MSFAKLSFALLTALTALAAQSALAETKIFTATASYTKPRWNNEFNELEQMGVERAAEKKAFGQCLDAGASDCVILEGAAITYCNGGKTDLHWVYCDAKARVRGTVL
jgi:hypothetical protein